MIEEVRTEFKARFGGKDQPVIVRSPGRVNLIGEHTDYNNGFVLPAAVDKKIYFAVAANNTETARIYSIDKNRGSEFTVTAEPLPHSDQGWLNYLIGVVQQLRRAGFTPGGFDCVFGGDIPIGAGMSSSAALENGLAVALRSLFDFDLSQEAIAKLSQRAENQFVGVQCGIMDQFANIFSKSGQVFKLDCRSLEREYYPFERDDLRVVLCEHGAALLHEADERVSSLRDVSLKLLREHRTDLDPEVFTRCEYVIEENLRVEAACAALQKENNVGFGALMNASHHGLSTKYAVSSPELDYLAYTAQGINGVLGSRMMGAGFGGCTINLVEVDAIDEFSAIITKEYQSEFDREALIYISTIEGGTSIVQD